MFQNIEKNINEEENDFEFEYEQKNSIKEFFKKNFTKQRLILYIVSFMISLVSFGINKELAPFSIAMFAAVLSNSIPVAIIFLLIAIGNTISFGISSTLNYILISLILLFGILIKSPRYDEQNDEKRRLGMRVFLACLFVKLASLIFKDFMVYDLLLAIVYSVSVYIFYKIFANSITVISKLGTKSVYSIEEIMGTSLTLAIAISCIGDFAIYGYSIRNILCILIVLVMGWKNGILVGGTAGITVGMALGVIGVGDISLAGTYAVSGMIAGIFSRLGRIGVVVGFIIGNVVLTYFANGNTTQIISFQEILIAALGLLAVPKRMKINIEEMYETKLLPETTSRSLEDNKETIYKLNTMSETLSEIAKSYKEAAATIVDEEELIKQEKENLQIFEKELENNIEGIEDNILFDDIYSPEEGLIEDIFDKLLENEMIVEKDLIEIFENRNNYIVINEETKDDVTQIVKIINYSYRVSKLNFIWKKKLDENKKTVSNQFEEVSKAIVNLAQDIEKTSENDDDLNIKEEIIEEFKEIDFDVNSINIEKELSGKIRLNIYTNICQSLDKPNCNIKKMTRIISKVLGQEVILQNQECGLRLNKTECLFTFTSVDKQTIDIGIAKASKSEQTISGDSNIQTKLADGKYLIAISDGKGFRKRSKKKQ